MLLAVVVFPSLLRTLVKRIVFAGYLRSIAAVQCAERDRPLPPKSGHRTPAAAPSKFLGTKWLREVLSLRP